MRMSLLQRTQRALDTSESLNMLKAIRTSKSNDTSVTLRWKKEIKLLQLISEKLKMLTVFVIHLLFISGIIWFIAYTNKRLF